MSTLVRASQSIGFALGIGVMVLLALGMPWNGGTVTRARAYWSGQIARAYAAGRPLLCPFCNDPIRPTQAFDVDHELPQVDGGDLGRGNQRPAHRSCNRKAGQAIGRHRTRARRTRSWL